MGVRDSGLETADAVFWTVDAFNATVAGSEVLIVGSVIGKGSILSGLSIESLSC